MALTEGDRLPSSLRSTAVADLIREAILKGTLGPGDPIRQEVFARTAGTSRAPVREALLQLEGEGLVTVVPHVGARVTSLDSGELIELYKIRESLEPMLVGESVPHLTKADLDRLTSLAEQMEGGVADRELWLELDRSFHLLSYSGAMRLPRAQEIVRDLWNRSHHYRRLQVRSLDRGRFEAVHLEHRLIVYALEHERTKEAGAITRSHIRRTRHDLLHRKLLRQS